MSFQRWISPLLAIAAVLLLALVGVNAPPEMALAGMAIGMVAKRKSSDDATADETLDAEQLKEAGRTDSQQEIRDYNAGDFQTTDPVTGLKRNLDQAPRVVRLDRGETLDADPDADPDAA